MRTEDACRVRRPANVAGNVGSEPKVIMIVKCWRQKDHDRAEAQEESGQAGGGEGEESRRVPSPQNGDGERVPPVRNPIHCGFDSSCARSAAAWTASMSVPRRPARSRTCRPAMVVPPGVVTLSFIWAGWRSDSVTICAAPRTV